MMCKICILAFTTAVLATSILADDAASTTQEQKPCHIKYQQFANHTMCLQKSPMSRTVEMTDELKKEIVDAHNWRRARVEPPATNMLKMRWSDDLGEMAQRWVDACESRNGLNHDNLRFIPGGMFIGQSMAMKSLNFNVAIDFWWHEKKDYKYGSDYERQVEAGGCGFMVGHYTQMAWADTYLIGCAATHCEGDDSYIVCNYGPAGNAVPFLNPYEAGERCSKCKRCEDDGLCDCGDMFCHGGNLDPTTCTCNCTITADGIAPPFVRHSDCSLNCDGKDFYYCGKDDFTNCRDSWTAKKCPHMCNVCPYAEKGYTSNNRTSEEL